MTDHDDPELDRLVRASLGTHAGEVDTAVPVVARARARQPGGGDRVDRRSVPPVAVAAVAVTAVVVNQGGPADPTGRPR